ncbi:RcnB family protein [Caenimonas aquaedulcis]|uniref:RcnB family protein n=1 Tax=Caenimonas aquaedulcis TaxID=2793270 RepID=A0A931H2V4_9BURK|nr:RcnB family protein [Caenimonas aquaedulcis]MBG9387550.1 RcnB family protein [Caenimonas aquaedulcis]
MARRFLFLAALLAASWSAQAQPNDSPNMVPGNEAYYIEHPWERYGGPYDNRWYQQREQDYRNGIRGAGPGRDLRIGQRYPRELINRQYSVDNLRAHNLFVPPQGYRWYQVGADYVLVEMATGRIAQTRYGR